MTMLSADNADPTVPASQVPTEYATEHIADLPVAADLSDNRFRLLADAIPQIVWISSGDGSAVLYLNERWHTYTGLSADQSFRFGPNQAIHPDDRERAQSLWVESLAQGVSYETELRLRAADGTYRWFLSRSVPVRNSAGVIVQWFGTSTDIDDRQRAEDEVRRTMARFALAEEAALGFVYEWDMETQQVYRSNGIHSMLGYTPEELEGDSLSWFSLIHPDDQPRVAGTIVNEPPLENRYAVEYRVRHKDGHYRFVWDRGLITRNDVGQPVRVIGSTVDITERKRAAATSALYAEVSDALSNSLDPQATLHRMLPLLVPNIADYCVVQLLANDNQMEVVATAHRDEVGKASLDALIARYQPLLAEDHIADQVINKRQPLLMTQVPADFIETMPPDPVVRELLRQIDPQSFIVVPMLSRQRIIGVLTLGLTDQYHRYNEGDLVVAQELARRCALALENAQLYAAAQQAIQQRDAFLSIAAHELRTPLTSMLGQAQLAQRRLSNAGVLSDRDRRSFEVIISQTVKLNRLITDLLDVSRLAQNQLQIARDPLDLAQLVEQVVEQTRPTLQIHTLHYAPSASAVIIEGDADRLEQVLQNLLTNAVKYSPEGGEIRVTLQQQHQYALLEISDQGIGIPAKALDNLFQRFFRAENATRLRIGGVGVGLYVVHEIVVLHGGNISVHSVENVGSTFRILLPLLQESA
jgi:PAS domain S-box-containing protein